MTICKPAVPEEAVLASLGCSNPAALAQLNAGETVLDLGSGGGIDVLLSARRVGPTGKAYGLEENNVWPCSAASGVCCAPIWPISRSQFEKDLVKNILL
jgi:hypothetical protein